MFVDGIRQVSESQSVQLTGRESRRTPLAEPQLHEKLPGGSRRHHSHRPAGGATEVLDVPGDHRPRAGLHRNLQKHDIVLVRQRGVGPRKRRDVHLELQDRKDRLASHSIDPQLRSRQDGSLLQLNAIVDGKPKLSSQDDIHQPPRRTGWRQKARDQDVCVEYPDCRVIHDRSAVLAAWRPSEPP